MRNKVSKKEPMNVRLRKARLEAGFESATAALETFKWKSSTYRAHENGQNNFNVYYAEQYAKAYGVTAAWLLIGDDTDVSPTTTSRNKKIPGSKIKSHKHDCIEHIFATALLLRDDKKNYSLLLKIKDCVDSEILKRKQSS